MAQYTLDGNEKKIEVLGIYASIKNNSDIAMYASSVSNIDPTGENVTPIQPGESVVIPANNERAVFVLGTGDTAVLSGNKEFNFFKPAPKGGGGGSGGGITQQQLNDTLKSYATNTSVDTKLEGYAEKDEIPTSLPADGGNADTVGGYKPGELIQDNPNIILNGNFRLNDSNKTDWTITGIGDYREITTVNNWMIGVSSTDQTVTASLSDAGLTITACARRGVYQPFEMKMVDYLKSLFSKSVGKILATVKVNNITGEWQLSQLNGKCNPSQKISTVGTHTVNFEWGDAYYDFQGLFAQNASSTESTITIEWIKAFPIDVYAPDPNIEMLRAYGYSAFSNPNLLDNPDFKINQRGMSEYSGIGVYTVDRWLVSNNGLIVKIENGSLILTNCSSTYPHFRQKLENPIAYAGQTVTLSVKFSFIDRSSNTKFRLALASGEDSSAWTWQFKDFSNDGVVSVTFKIEDRLNAVSLILVGDVPSSVKIEWIKLEIGKVATPFIPPNPATELLKCQRYLQPVIVSRRNDGWHDFDHSFSVNLILDPQMRVAPTVLNPECLSFDTEYGSGAWQHTGEFTFNSDPRYLDIRCVVPESNSSVLPACRMFSGKVGYDGQKDYLWLSAEL